MAEFVRLQAAFEPSPKSWTAEMSNIDQETFDLSVKNPHAADSQELRSPLAILDEIAALDAESTRLLERVRALL